MRFYLLFDPAVLYQIVIFFLLKDNTSLKFDKQFLIFNQVINTIDVRQ